MIEAVLDGRLAVSQVYRDRLATCTGCLACESRCASGVPAASIIAAAKEQAVREQGPGLIAAAIAATIRQPALLRSLAWLAPLALHYAGEDMRGGRKHPRSAERRARDERPGKSGSAERVLFFPGCAVRQFQRDIEDAVITVLEGLGCEVIVPKGLVCCGRPFLSLGDRTAAADLAAGNAAALAAAGADAIVTACASCGLTFKREYPTLLGPATAPAVLDIHEFLAGRLAGLDLGRLEGRITVHDPCHLGRGQGLAGAMRTVLGAVPGLDRVEMRDPDRCCGFGGVMRATHPALSAAIGRLKARDIIGTGAPLVATGCPGCRMQIADALRRAGSAAEVVHPVQVIAEAMRIAECGTMIEDREPAASRP